MRQYIWMAALGFIVVAIGAAYISGAAQERTKSVLKGLKEFVETRERIDDASQGLDTGDDVDDRLRELAE